MSHVCQIEAAVQLQSSLALFTTQSVYFYDNEAQFTSGSVSSQPITTFLPGWTGNVDAAYADVTKTHVYVIQGNCRLNKIR
jgi:hypothetical protein